MSLSGLFAKKITQALEKHGYITQSQYEFYFYTYDWIAEQIIYYGSLIISGIFIHLFLFYFICITIAFLFCRLDKMPTNYNNMYYHISRRSYARNSN